MDGPNRDVAQACDVLTLAHCAPRFVLECTTSTTVVQIIFRRQNDGDARRIDES